MSALSKDGWSAKRYHIEGGATGLQLTTFILAIMAILGILFGLGFFLRGNTQYAFYLVLPIVAFFFLVVLLLMGKIRYLEPSWYVPKQVISHATFGSLAKLLEAIQRKAFE